MARRDIGDLFEDILHDPKFKARLVENPEKVIEAGDYALDDQEIQIVKEFTERNWDDFQFDVLEDRVALSCSFCGSCTCGTCPSLCGCVGCSCGCSCGCGSCGSCGYGECSCGCGGCSCGCICGCVGCSCGPVCGCGWGGCQCGCVCICIW